MMERAGESRKMYRRRLARDMAKKSVAGIYKITNNDNGKIFIGSAANIAAKRNSTWFQLNMGSAFMNKELQEDWNRLGAECFSFDVLCELELRQDEQQDVKRELEGLLQLWLDELKPFAPVGYNKAGG